MLVDIGGLITSNSELSKAYIGTVVDNADPKKLGRVKCSIPLIFEYDKEILPWIYPCTVSSNSQDVPEIGEKLKIVFRNKDIYSPEYVGYAQTVGKINPDFDADYPDSIGYSKQGFKLKYNKKSKTGAIVHPSGSTLNLSDAGDINMTLKGDMSVTSDKSVSISSKSDMSFSSDAKVTVSGKAGIDIVSDAQIKVNGKGGVEVVSDAQAKFAGKAGTVLGDNSSQTMVNGQAVLLAGGGSPVALLGSQAMGVGNMGAPVISTIITGSSKVLSA